MRGTIAVTVFLALTFLLSAQNDLPVFKTETASAFVWREDNPSEAMSSVQDPVTGNAIHKLNHGRIEVSSRAGFETIGLGEAVHFLSFTTTIVNNSESGLSVQQGTLSVDGHVALPLSVVLTKKGLSKKDGKQVYELVKMHCFSSGFLPNEEFFSPKPPAKLLFVAPKRALTVSFVTRDPRYYSVLCSTEGCYPKGTMRFSVKVNATDFVFIWPGRTMIDCGR